MSLKTRATMKRWCIIATDQSGQRGYFSYMTFWTDKTCTSKDIRFARMFPSKKAAEYAVTRWAKTLLTDIEYLPVTFHIRLNNTRRRQEGKH